jgi:hypothetical protein
MRDACAASQRGSRALDHYERLHAPKMEVCDVLHGAPTAKNLAVFIAVHESGFGRDLSSIKSPISAITQSLFEQSRGSICQPSCLFVGAKKFPGCRDER